MGLLAGHVLAREAVEIAAASSSHSLRVAHVFKFVSGHPRPGRAQRGRSATPRRAAGRRIRVASEPRERRHGAPPAGGLIVPPRPVGQVCGAPASRVRTFLAACVSVAFIFEAHLTCTLYSLYTEASTLPRTCHVATWLRLRVGFRARAPQGASPPGAYPSRPGSRGRTRTGPTTGEATRRAVRLSPPARPCPSRTAGVGRRRRLGLRGLSLLAAGPLLGRVDPGGGGAANWQALASRVAANKRVHRYRPPPHASRRRRAKPCSVLGSDGRVLTSNQLERMRAWRQEDLFEARS